MKKMLILTALIIFIMCLFKSETVVIPKEAIRFRVIANSNNQEDQNVKKEIVDDLSKEISKMNLFPKNIEISRKIIKEKIPVFQTTINNTLKRMKQDTIWTIDYGMNYFPKKEYKGVIYEEGEYESLVVKIGDAKGDNFWCVLFPPLCLLEGEEKNGENIEYVSLIKEIINKYF